MLHVYDIGFHKSIGLFHRLKCLSVSECLGGSSNDTAGSRRERQHLVRDSNNHGLTGFSAPLEMRAIDSDSESNRSRKSGGSVRMQQMPMVHPAHHHPHMQPPQPSTLG